MYVLLYNYITSMFTSMFPPCISICTDKGSDI